MKKQQIILDDEGKFKSRLLDACKEKNYKMLKSHYRYASIDFIIINLENLKSVYIEHKKKNINGNNFDSFMINKCKIDSCKKDFKKCIFIWDCLDDVYWLYYNKELHQSRLEEIYGSDVYFINKKLVNVGFDSLIESINKFIN